MANIYSTITYNANLSPAQAQIKALTGQIAGLTAAFNTLDKSAVRAQSALASTFMANVGQIGGFNSQIVKSGTALDNFGNSLAKQRLTMRQYFREAIAGYTKQNSLMKQLAAQQVRMQQSMLVPMGGPGAGTAVLTPTAMSSMGTAAAMASQKFSIFNELVRGGSERLLNFGKNTQWTGRQLMVGFTLPLVLFTALVSKQFREIDKELTRFEKVYGGDLAGSVKGATESMREQVKQLAFEISSSYGIAAKETAALAADIAQTGKEGEDLIASVRQTTRLAVLGEVERQEAMRATLSIQNAFKLNTNELSEAIDFLNAVENQTSTNLQDLAGAIPRVGPVIQALGGDIKDMSLLLVAMREGGVSAAEAANALKSGLGRLINPTKQAREVAASFGVSLQDIIQNSRGELLPMIFGLQDALAGLDDFARAQVLEKVFGKYQFARMTALFDNLRRQGSQTLSVMELASASSSELAGIANKELRALQESSSMRFQRSIENLKNSLVPLGEILTEAFIPILSAIGSGLKGFMDFFQSLPEPVKNFSKYAILVTALAGPVVMLVGLFGNLIANGIKFSMMIVRLGARIAGLRFEKFELLTADVIAARQGVDNLTTSFMTQEGALKRLLSVMSTYSASLATLMRTNPQLFTTTAPARQIPVIRRQRGSRMPETVPGGYGGGDKVPALLEPGEFVVRKEAAVKYAPILASMNRGDLQGFSKGSKSSDGVPYDMRRGYSGPRIYERAHVTPYVDVSPGVAKRHASPSRQSMIDADIASGRTTVRLFTNLVVDLTKGTNTLLKTTGVQAQYLARQLGNSQAYESIMKMTSLSMRDIQPVADVLRSRFAALGAEIVDDPKLYSIVGQELRQLALSGDKAAQTMLKLSGQYGSFAYGPNQQRTRLGVGAAGVPSYIDVGGIERSAEWHTKEMAKGLQRGVDKGLKQSIRSGSPSREADLIGFKAGTSLGQGAVNGLRRGMTAATAAPVSPVGIGLEGRSLRSQIATKEQSILKFTEMQEKAARNRTIAEGQILNIQLEHAKIMKRTDIPLSERLILAQDLRNQLMEQKNIVKSSTVLEKRASDNVTQAKNDLAALIRKTPPPAFFTPLGATAGTAGNTSSVAIMGGLAGNKTSPTNNVGIVSTARPSSPTMTVGGFTSGSGSTTSTGRSGTVSVQGLKPTPSTAASTGPAASVSSAQQAAARQPGMAGMGAMNALFMISMMTSSLAMLGGQSNDLSMKLGILTSAVMAASMAMMMFSGRNVMGNFLGMRSLGARMGQAATNRAAAGGANVVAQSVGSRAPIVAGAGGALTKVGGSLGVAARALSVLGGPVGIAAGLAVTGVITGFMILKKRAEEARERMISAFAEPTKVAEYFGQTIEDVNKTIEMNKLANITTDVGEVSEDLRKVVKEDYEKLIERLQETTSIIGARDLSVAFASMITSGISAENARAAIEAIAVEAGEKGGEAFAEAMSSNLLKIETVEDAVNVIAGQFDPNRNKELSKSIKQYQDRLNELEGERESLIIAAEERQTQPSSGRRTPRTIRPEGRGSVRLTQEEYRRYSDIQKEVKEIKKSLEEIFDISPDKLIPSVEQLIMAYSDAPREVAEAMSVIESEILSSTDNQGEYLNQIKDFLNRTYSEDMAKYGSSIDTIEEATAALKLVTSGVSLNRAVNDADQFSLSLANAITKAKNLADITGQLRLESEQEYFGMVDEFFAEERLKLQADLEINQENLDSLRETVESEFFGNGQFIGDIQIRTPLEARERELELNRRNIEELNRLSEERIDSYQEEMDAAQEKYDADIELLENERDSIEESTDAYIKSIEKRQRADSFYANQRKASLSALGKLAAGDVFGFLKERQEMSQAAQEFSYENEIESIEERRDLELKSIEDQVDARKKEQEEYRKNMEEKIELERDLVKQRNKAQENADRNHQKLVDQFNERVLVATATAQKEKEELQKKLNFISKAEEEYRTDATAAEEKYSEEYGRLKSKPFVDARKEFMKLRIEEIFYRGGVTLQEAIIQAGFQSESYDPAEIQQEINKIAEDLNLRYGTRGSRRYGPDDVYLGMTAPDTGAAPPFSAKDVTIQDPANVYINGVDVGTGDPRDDPDFPGRVATGGYISGPGTPTSDSIPARLSNGEYVIRASSVKKYGKGMMDEINAARFAKGGIVGPPERGLSGFMSLTPPPTPKKPPKGSPAGSSGSSGSAGSVGQPGTPRPTSTSLIAHPSQGGPNRWPYSGYQSSSGKIPGTSKYVSLNRDVLPLFLAFASDYNRLIRPINTIYGIGSRSGNFSNHPSGTAVDINPSEEGQYFGWGQSIAKKKAVIDWWAGKKSSLANWDSKTPVPYKTVAALMNKYKVLQWFGPRSQGGFIIDEYGNNDPMHFQITQSRTVSPKEVSSTIASLGINSDGTFRRPSTYSSGGIVKKFAAGGFISGPGGPKSDSIPAMLSNGEYVVKADSVNKYGRGFLDQVNAGKFNAGGLVGRASSSVPAMISPASASMPTFGMPSMPSSSLSINNSGVSSNTNTNNSSRVNIVINGASQNANAIANKVVRMINSSNNRRVHSRSA